MFSFSRLILVLVIAHLVMVCAEKQANAQDIDEAGIRELVKKLGDDSFRVRAAAQAKLIDIGPPAESALEAVSNSQNLETRYRARKILQVLRATRSEWDRKNFLDGKVDQISSNNKSWQRFKKMVGNSREARQLFLEMQNHGRELLNAAETDKKQCELMLGTLFEKDYRIRIQGGSKLPKGQVAAMVFAGSQPGYSSFLSRCSSIAAFNHKSLGKNKAFRKLLGKWLSNLCESHANTEDFYPLLSMARKYELTEGAKLARKIIEANLDSGYKGHAFVTIGAVGLKKDLEFLQKHINDETVVNSRTKNDVKYECRLGDVVLAMCLVLTDQKCSDYGFAWKIDGKQSWWDYTAYGFNKPEHRQAARLKWQRWKQKAK